MRIWLLGGTGSIGTPLLHTLLKHGHAVIALARSDRSARKLQSAGADVRRGDIRAPEQWVSQIRNTDAIVNVAATFDRDEELIERRLLDALLPHLITGRRRVRLIYTGGCWLYGETDGSLVTERSPYSPLPAFSWSLTHIRRLLNEPGLDPIIIHPAMVFTPTAGVFERFYQEASGSGPVRIIGGEAVRWPLVHSEDLAELYRLVLERGLPRQAYIGCAIEGLPVGRIARAFIARLRTTKEAPQVMSEPEAIAAFGHLAAGYVRDQLQSGEKACRELGWVPVHTDPLNAIATLPRAAGTFVPQS